MSASRADFAAGVRDVLPMLLGFVPFGVITGVTAVGVGLSSFEAVLMSATVYAGTAQLAAIELLDGSAPLGVIVVTGLLINLRFSMFSASLAPHLRPVARPWKWVAGYLLSTPSYVLSVTAFETDEALSRRWYYLGTALPVWLTWQGATVVGVVVGARVPPELQLDFVIPLVFLVLLFTLLDDRATWIAAVAAGLVAVAGELVPLNLGLIVATLGGVAAGLVVERRGG